MTDKQDKLLLTPKERDKIRLAWVSTAHPWVFDSLIEETAKAQLAKARKELCGNCDTPLLREGELYQKLELAKRQERERILKLLPEITKRNSFNKTCYDCVERIKEQALKKGEM